jgi:hypothetical protein
MGNIEVPEGFKAKVKYRCKSCCYATESVDDAKEHLLMAANPPVSLPDGLVLGYSVVSGHFLDNFCVLYGEKISSADHSFYHRFKGFNGSDFSESSYKYTTLNWTARRIRDFITQDDDNFFFLNGEDIGRFENFAGADRAKDIRGELGIEDFIYNASHPRVVGFD